MACATAGLVRLARRQRCLASMMSRRRGGRRNPLGVRVRRVRVFVHAAPERNGPVHGAGSEAAARLGRRAAKQVTAPSWRLSSLGAFAERRNPRVGEEHAHGQVRAGRRHQTPAARASPWTGDRAAPRPTSTSPRHSLSSWSWPHDANRLSSGEKATSAAATRARAERRARVRPCSRRTGARSRRPSPPRPAPYSQKRPGTARRPTPRSSRHFGKPVMCADQSFIVVRRPDPQAPVTRAGQVESDSATLENIAAVPQQARALDVGSASSSSCATDRCARGFEGKGASGANANHLSKQLRWRAAPQQGRATAGSVSRTPQTTQAPFCCSPKVPDRRRRQGSSPSDTPPTRRSRPAMLNDTRAPLGRAGAS